MKKVFTAIFLLVCVLTYAQEVNIIPQPTSVTKRKAHLALLQKQPFKLKVPDNKKRPTFLINFYRNFMAFN